MFNIYIGISLGNRYFTKERVRAYILWALAHTKDDVAVLIADDPHAINLQALKGYTSNEARRSAEQSGDETVNMIQSIINGLPKEQQPLVHIVRWRDVEAEEHYEERYETIRTAFHENSKFHETIESIVQNTFEGNVPVEQLSEYVLRELPPFLFGLHYKGKHYTALPYPGLSAIDDLVVAMQRREVFPELADRLKLDTKSVFIEAYVD